MVLPVNNEYNNGGKELKANSSASSISPSPTNTTTTSTTTVDNNQTKRKSSIAENKDAPKSDCIDTCIESPLSCMWIHELGDKFHPAISVLLYTILCPVTMPCLCTVGGLLLLKSCSMGEERSDDDDDSE